ncbi:hypothetical protein [Marinomonas ostreistagni]|uniref:Lipoprotein n=1 Tax=Marinomonas ostreistagni TaxID=359209 RepID=A0ABS0ZEQ7_9GAMM|nr:hypothetical protein [Marinomonas ostreistagni]MBJ7552097.1 hypothetical protein [Marinomonas ostreistagni]
MNFKNISYLILAFILLSGCSVIQNKPEISEREAFSYIKEFQRENYELKKSGSHEVLWIQAKNKKEECKVYTYSHNSQFGKDDENHTYWDGGCKDGYAYGLGREFYRSKNYKEDNIAIYHTKQQKPNYYIGYDLINGYQYQGDLNKNSYVKIQVIQDPKLDVYYTYGDFNYPQKSIYTSEIAKKQHIMKRYMNFDYDFIIHTSLDNRKIKYGFYTKDQDLKAHGFWFEFSSHGDLKSGEAINKKITSYTSLPKKYYDHVALITKETIDAGQKAIDHQRKALAVKKQYISKICINNAHVNFISDIEYKAICNESVYFKDIAQQLKGRGFYENASAKGQASASPTSIDFWDNLVNHEQIKQLHQNLLEN